MKQYVFQKNAQTNDFETSKQIKERLDNLYYGLAIKPEIHIVGCL